MTIGLNTGKCATASSTTLFKTNIGGQNSLYTPLPASPPHIRVIELLPGHGPLRYRLQTVLLQESNYETVSYRWTTACLDDPVINVNDQEITIRQSLAAALTRLRRPEAVRVLWVDALCINQNSNAEKSDQVSKMREIYSSGSHNNIWLGAHDASTARAVEFVKDITSEARRTSFDIRTVTSGIMLSPESPFYLFLALCARP